MSTMHSDSTPQAAPVEWHAAPGVGPEQAAAPAAPTPRKNRGKIAAGVAALLIAVGGTTGYLVSHANSSSATASTAQPGAAGGAAAGGPGGAGGDLGFQPTQYHLSGTITAVGNGTVTIRTASATTTYTVTSSTHLVNGGTSVSLSSFRVGDSVVASTTTQGGTTLNDMMVGTPGGGRGAAGAAPQGTTGTTT